jgi:hypothetical protein
MHGEQQRHSRPDRLPRRPVDRIEDLVAWMLVALALLAVAIAAVTAARVHGEAMHRVEAETRERIQVQAVLLEPASYALQVDDRGRAVKLRSVIVPARYTAPDGIERQADAQVVGPLPAGAAVPVWVDRSGAIVRAPTSSGDAMVRAATSALGVLAAGGVILGGIWIGVHGAALRLSTARWGREWEQVEPQWSGRTP